MFLLRARGFIKPLIRRAFKIPSAAAQTGKVCGDGSAPHITVWRPGTHTPCLC